MTQLAALLLLVLLALVVPLPVHAQCPPGTVAAPASFDNIIQPALAVDTNPSADVVEVFLTAREAMVDYGTGNQTLAWTYNGVVPGPTIEAEVGNTLIVNFCNNLPDETTIHWHGIETPANMDGSNISQLSVPPGGTFRYELPLLVAGTFWYHPHIRTDSQLERGLHALLIVRDPVEDTALGLPTREHLFVLDDTLLDASGQVVPPRTSGGDRATVALEILNGREGSIPLLNGVSRPRLSMETGVPHRIRILDAANSRIMRMGFVDTVMWRIGGDQGLLERPIEIQPPLSDSPTGAPSGEPGFSDPNPSTGLFITPGERADVVLSFSGSGSRAFLWHDTRRGRHSVEFASDGVCPEGGRLCREGVSLAHNLPDGTLPWLVFAQIDLFGANATTYTPPAELRTIQRIDTTGATALPLILGHTFPNFNNGELAAFIQGPGKPFELVTPEDAHQVRAGGTYVWEVRNLTDGLHNFHLHGWSFQKIETEWVDLDDPGREKLRGAGPLPGEQGHPAPARALRHRHWPELDYLALRRHLHRHRPLGSGGGGGQSAHGPALRRLAHPLPHPGALRRRHDELFRGLQLRTRAKITTHSWTPIHPVWLRCSSVIYLDIIHFSHLAIRAPRRPRMGIYSCPDP